MLIRLAATAATLLLSTAAFADTVSLTDPVAGHPGKTYADLVGQYVGDLKLNDDGTATANLTTGYRFVDDGSEPSEPLGAVTVSAIHAETFRSGGTQMLAVTADLQGEDDSWPTVVLGAFGPDLKLVDDVEVDLDQFVSIDAPMAIGAKDDAIIVHSTHFNAGESYDLADLVYLSGSALKSLPTLGAYSFMTCEYQNNATASYAATDDGQGGFWPITATLKVDHSLNTDCNESADGAAPAADAPADDAASDEADAGMDSEPVEPAWVKSATDTYSWSASLGGYVQQTDNITSFTDALGYY